jgi:hypothetical protein
VEHKADLNPSGRAGLSAAVDLSTPGGGVILLLPEKASSRAQSEFQYRRPLVLNIAHEGSLLLGDNDSSNVHQLVLLHGRERALEMVDARTRPLVDIAAEVLADDTQRIGISYTGFCLTALPHKRLPDDQPWEKKGHHVTLLVERMGGRSMPFRRYGVRVVLSA